MKRFSLCIWALGSALLLLPVGVANGQPGLPVENHYKVYLGASNGSVSKAVTLVDQFGTVTVDQLTLSAFSTPVEKRHDGQIFPMVDPLAHQTWWEIYAAPQPERTVMVRDQLGTRSVTVGDVAFLVTPSLKWVQGQPPQRNHYLCYWVVKAPVLNKIVTLVDQFGTKNVYLFYPELFCNPVEKRVDGVVYPIVDATAHLYCYNINYAPPFPPEVRMQDQFGYWNFYAGAWDYLLCMPALKDDVVRTERTTWGQIKALYR